MWGLGTLSPRTRWSEKRCEHGLPHASSCDSPLTRVYENAETGVRIRPFQLYGMVRNPHHGLQRRAGLPELTLHDIRHTSATIALLAGVHPKVVSERHGHASTQITLDRYSHVIESMQVAAAQSIDRFLSSDR